MANRRKQGQRHTLPHSIEAERSVIGSVLLHPPAISQLLDLRPSQFYHPLHDNLWRVILELARAGTQIDQVTLGNRCEADAMAWTALCTAGGIAYFSELMNAVVTVENLDHHVKIIQDHAHRRLMAELAQRIATEALDQDSDVGRLAEDLEALAAHTESARRKVEPYETIDPAQCCWPKPTVWSVDYWIPVRKSSEPLCCLLAGEPKSQKSFVLTDLAIALAYGGDWLGMRVRGGNRVLVYNAEDAIDMTLERYGRLCFGRNFDAGKPGVDEDGKPSVLLPGYPDLIRFAKRPGGWEFTTPRGRARFVELCRTWKPAYVICDPLVNLIGDVDENKAGEMMARFLGPMRELSQELGFTLILAHHVSKPAQTKSTTVAGSIFDRLRGTSALRGWSAAHAYVEVMAYETPKLLKIHFEQKQGAGRSPQLFALDEPDGIGKGPCRFAVLDDADGGAARATKQHGRAVEECTRRICSLISTSSTPIPAEISKLRQRLSDLGYRPSAKILKEAVAGLEDIKQLTRRQLTIGSESVTCYDLIVGE